MHSYLYLKLYIPFTQITNEKFPRCFRKVGQARKTSVFAENNGTNNCYSNFVYSIRSFVKLEKKAFRVEKCAAFTIANLRGMLCYTCNENFLWVSKLLAGCTSDVSFIPRRRENRNSETAMKIAGSLFCMRQKISNGIRNHHTEARRW